LTVTVISVELTTLMAETATFTEGLVGGVVTPTVLTGHAEVAAAEVVKPVPMMVRL
jgi:hypothetical protein